MHSHIVSANYVLIGFTLYAAATHLSFGLKPPHAPVNVLFGLMLLAAVPADFFYLSAIGAPDAASYLAALRGNLSFIILMLIALPHFLSAYTNQNTLRLNLLLNTVAVGLLLANLVLPHTLQYRVFTGIHAQTLPWGDIVITGTGLSSDWSYFSIFAGSTILLDGLRRLAGHHHAHPDRYTLGMLVSYALFLSGSTIGILGRLQIIPFVPLGMFSFMIMILMLSLVLAQQTHDRLRESESRFRSLIEQSPFSTMVLAPDGTVLQTNPAWTRLWERTIPPGVRCNIFHDPDCSIDGLQEALRLNMHGTVSEIPAIAITRRNEQDTDASAIRWIRGYAYPIRNESGAIQASVLVHEDVTDKMLVQHTLQRLAYEDLLTGLPNRIRLHERLEADICAARARLERGALLLIDLDHFKTINDALGHRTGDMILQRLAQRLTEQFGQAFIARPGGDEFAIILPASTLSASRFTQYVDEMAKTVHDTLTASVSLHEHSLRVGASVGMALFPEAQDEAADVLRHAEMALYAAKKQGRNQISLYETTLQVRATGRLQLEAGLRNALERNELALHFQPQVDDLGGVVGAEVLLRWIHPLHGVIPPGQFIPIAEETGIIHSIGDWLFTEAFSRLPHWTSFHGYLSINVSPWQFASADFVHRLMRAASEHRVPRQRIMLELTESALLHDLPATISKLDLLRKSGFRIALDDFGTGYSSLAYLQQLPLDAIKIDKSFVDKLETQPDNPLVASIIDIGQRLHLSTVAEGVENTTCRDALLRFGCTHFQGYLYSRPLAEHDFLDWLKQHSLLSASG